MGLKNYITITTMPKTSLFETELRITQEYIEMTYPGLDPGDVDKDEIIKPGMTFMMNYTHTRYYASEDACVKVTVESVRIAVYNEMSDGIVIIGCVLTVDEPIFVCESGAFLARGITLHTEDTTIASGCVTRVKI
jgi:hypothetical protein